MSLAHWKIIDRGINSAEENMRFDTQLLTTPADHPLPIIHFYDWEGPSATYGHFAKPEEWLDLNSKNSRQIQLAKRPTGGGITFHLWDMAFSVFVPSHCPEFSENTLNNYNLINSAVLNAIYTLFPNPSPFSLIKEDLPLQTRECNHFCMARPTKYDVIWEGKKIAGAAQRKTKNGFLHQGTIFLTPPCWESLSNILLPDSGVLGAMQSLSHPLLKNTPSQEELLEIKEELKTVFATHLDHLSAKLERKKLAQKF